MATKDLVADYSGVGDGQRTTVTGSITAATNPVFTPASNIFAAFGDPTGRAIFLNCSGLQYEASITSYNAGTGAVTLNGTNGTVKSSVSFDVLWGTDNTTAFMAFRTFAQTQGSTQTVLTIPAGRYCASLDPQHPLALGCQNVLISGPLGAAATCILSQLVAAEMRFGGAAPIGLGLNDAGGNSARLQTCAAGATTATLVTNSGVFNTRLNAGVGKHCFVTCYDMQGQNNSDYGYPPNPFFYETNIIAGFNSGTGIITFQNPLANTYKSTYPKWSDGSAFGADQGGPATIYVLSDYDRVVEINDISIDCPYNQVAAHGRAVILRRSICPGFYPTQNSSFSAYSTSWSGTEIEVDKLNETVLYDACDIGILRIQSASPNLLTIQNGCTLSQLQGTPKKLVMDGGTCPLLNIGTGAFGRTDEVSISNVSGITTFGALSSGTDGIEGAGVSTSFPLTGGLFSFLKSANDGGGFENPTRGLVPGTWLFIDYKAMCQITDVYEDGTSCYVQTNLPGSWPFTVTQLRCSSAPKFTMRNCTGTAPELEDWNQAPAAIPLYSYSKRTYVAGASAATPSSSNPLVYGKLVTMKFTVTSLFTGGTALAFNQSQFDNGRYLKQSDYSLKSDLKNTINMKTGLNQTRVVANAVAGSNAQSGDSLFDFSALGSVWFYIASNSNPNFTANVSNGDTPTVVVEWIMDQGIPQVGQSARVRLRIR